MPTLKLKIIKMGNRAALLLPKTAFARLKIAPGDTVFLTEASQGFRLTAHDADFARQIESATHIANKRRKVLRKLAR
jgi:putative addiction module antidote